MKILIIGPLGAGKSSLAYAINKKFNFPRLNLDEVCRCPNDGSYYQKEEQFEKLNHFLNNNNSWVAEGCQKYLYETMPADLIIDMRIHRLVAIWRFTWRFLKAKKLIGKSIDGDLPIQAYHYRKPTFAKIKEYDAFNQKINLEIGSYLERNKKPVIKCKRFDDYQEIFEYINTFSS